MSATLQTSLKEKICESVEIPIFTRCCFCFPLRKGLITFAYFNTILSILDVAMLSYLVVNRSSDMTGESEYPRLIIDTTSMVLEFVMSVIFIAALHMKHVLLMKVYLYFEIVFSILAFIYGLVFLGEETASELFLILFQLTIQIYLVILIWSSIVKMERDDSVKYTRERENV
ncbi:uncharacterized protein LOC110991726 [Pieris rapae]|uniref:uncharacterized protein LOC110991726 n=1 Tax=Pieris rapae TaxID=64459 RepID=UPI000B92BCCB|nr:uncharacterized protein LOC110991726 [Pieris rapae]XP_045484569.1 uncharacterized protein LOC110991726 [Pieris rapae]